VIFKRADFEFVRSELDTPHLPQKKFQPPAPKPSLRPVVLAYPTLYLVDELSAAAHMLAQLRGEPTQSEKESSVDGGPRCHQHLEPSLILVAAPTPGAHPQDF